MCLFVFHIHDSFNLKQQQSHQNIGKIITKQLIMVVAQLWATLCYNTIPFSLAMRIVRICSEVDARENGFGELKELLIAKEYRPGMIHSAISKARAIPRAIALKEVV